MRAFSRLTVVFIVVPIVLLLCVAAWIFGVKTQAQESAPSVTPVWCEDDDEEEDFEISDEEADFGWTMYIDVEEAKRLGIPIDDGDGSECDR
ncbi:hypothetical protein P4N68_09505 [Corynebacterium felinum]|uniref:Secreted protein n=1 Tax=Corynebacterium felinum TaxID=131318 RepID=A0ABU2B962_9CORY|nr:hypothetical protein [Corynebacterium felinum]MDF5821311.1 hypothetical protein [Corynebacterium felinum]MDR7354806.1 hypothetical protein [Corynebacterium felinum]WJY94166.1 hypothetical protein CFELI_02620 [Corynebacterium felinum]